MTPRAEPGRASPLLPLLLLALWAGVHRAPPQEDAHILFRYARNLAQGHGLTWNPGEDPVEGATAFLWTVLLAGCERVGLGAIDGSVLLSGLALAGTVLAFPLLGPRVGLQPRHGLLAACLVALSPLVVHLGTGFSAPLMGLLLLLLTFALARHAFGEVGDRAHAAHAVPALGLALGLTRPEGAAVAVLAIGCGLALARPEERARVARLAAVWFVLPGAVYFVGRWIYFGAVLPNTFYAKARLFPPDAARSLLLGARPLVWLGALLLPALVVAALGLWRWPARERLRFALVALPVLAFPLTHAVVVQVQNVAHRYQAPAIPAALLLAALAASRAPLPAPLLQRAFAALCALWFGGFTHQVRIRPTPPDLQRIGEALRPLAEHDVRLLSSEAGVLPWYSQWPAADPFGLYDEHVAHHGLDDAWLDRQRPDVILFHAFSATWSPTFGGTYAQGHWNEMVQHLHRYALSRSYELAAIVRAGADPDDVHWYWVRPDAPDKGAILAAIRDHPELEYR